MSEKPKKVYILDTNVLIHDPQSIFSFANTIIGIPAVVLEELDQLKKEPSDRGSSARTAIRHLDNLRARGSLRDGVHLDNGSILQVIFPPNNLVEPMPFFTHNLEDNQILSTALYMKSQGYQVVFISKDINARVKADVLNIQAEDYLKGRVAEYDIYKGWRVESIPANDLRKDQPLILQDLASQMEINEFISLQSENNPQNYRVFRYLGHQKFKNVQDPQLAWPLKARNPQQLMALDLLLDDRIQLVSLVGPAGTGKTFLALLAGLHQVLVKDVYRKIMISRPVVPLGPDIGYLPGTVQEKLESWMQPMYDNLSLIMHSAAGERHARMLEQESGVSRSNGKGAGNGSGNGKKPKKTHHGGDRFDEHRMLTRGFTMDDLVRSGKLSLEAMTYMRGRSIPFQYILLDEVQNLTVHEVKTLITRVGEGSKMIIAGDPYQIDSSYLDFSSNGLVIAGNRFKGQGIFGTVFLEHSERSELSSLAAQLL